MPWVPLARLAGVSALRQKGGVIHEVPGQFEDHGELFSRGTRGWQKNSEATLPLFLDGL